MGGRCMSKEEFINDDGTPKNFFKLSEDPYNWICGGGFPAFKQQYDHLIHENVGLIVTLTIEPIKIGRNINHIPFDYDTRTYWIDTDDIKDQLINSRLYIFLLLIPEFQQKEI